MASDYPPDPQRSRGRLHRYPYLGKHSLPGAQLEDRGERVAERRDGVSVDDRSEREGELRGARGAGAHDLERRDRHRDERFAERVGGVHRRQRSGPVEKAVSR